MIPFIYLFTILFISNFNLFIKNVFTIPEPPKVNKLVDLDLAKINNSHFYIIESDRPPESFKITPLEGKVITVVTINNDPLWIKQEASQCESVSVYNTSSDLIIISLNIIENDHNHAINFFKQKNTLKDAGLTLSLVSLNKDFINRGPIRKSIDLHCPFDMLFFNSTYRKLDNFELYVYESGETRQIKNVFHKLDKIWEPTTPENFCKRILIFKRNGGEILTKIIDSDQNVLYLRSRVGGWKSISQEDYNFVYNNLHLINLTAVPNINNFKDPNLINIFLIKKNLSFTKQFGLLGDNVLFSIHPLEDNYVTNSDEKKSLVFDGITLLEIEKHLTEITFIKSKDGYIFVEITTRKDGLRGPNIYLKREKFSNKWIKMKQSDFYEQFKNSLVNYEIPSEVRYYYVAGEITGSRIDQIPEHLLSKIRTEQPPNYGSPTEELGTKQETDVLNKPIVTDEPTQGLPELTSDSDSKCLQKNESKLRTYIKTPIATSIKKGIEVELRSEGNGDKTDINYEETEKSMFLPNRLNLLFIVTILISKLI